jgi:hypothetical protein
MSCWNRTTLKNLHQALRKELRKILLKDGFLVNNYDDLNFIFTVYRLQAFSTEYISII